MALTSGVPNIVLPRNAQDWNVVTSPFQKGETTSLSATFPVKIGGLTGYQGLRGVYLADIPRLILPPMPGSST